MGDICKAKSILLLLLLFVLLVLVVLLLLLLFICIMLGHMTKKKHPFWQISMFPKQGHHNTSNIVIYFLYVKTPLFVLHTNSNDLQ